MTETETEMRQELFRAVGCNCTCQFDEAGDIVQVCEPHKAIAEDEASFVHHMVNARLQRDRWVAAEHGVNPAA